MRSDRICMMRKIYPVSILSLTVLLLAGCGETENVPQTIEIIPNNETVDEIEDVGFGEQNNEDVELTDGSMVVSPPTEGDAGYVYLVLESSLNTVSENEGTLELYYVEGEEEFRLYLMPDSREGITVNRVNENQELEKVDSSTSTLIYLKNFIEQSDGDCVTQLSLTEYEIVNKYDTGEIKETYLLNIRGGIITDIQIQFHDKDMTVLSSRHLNIQYGLTDEDVAQLPPTSS
jgi:hypothetical protein